MGSQCSACDYENPLGANFCMSCGRSLERQTGERNTESLEPTVDSPAVSDPLVEGPQGMFVVRQGQNRGSRIALDLDRVTIGRHPESDIFLDDITVSRRHAEFVRHGSAFEVKDLGSLNGTYFDGVVVDQALLHDGAEVQVGKFRMTFYSSRHEGESLGSAK